MKKRGRPRKHGYKDIAEFLLESEELKKKYLNLKNTYLFHRMIVMTLKTGAQYEFGIIGLEKGRSGLGMKGDAGKRLIRQGFRNRKTGKYDEGRSLTVDLNHDPPRLRILLTNGEFKDLPLKCPVCGDPLLKEPIQDEQWEDSFDIFCPNGHFGPWRVDVLQRWAEEQGFA